MLHNSLHSVSSTNELIIRICNKNEIDIYMYVYTHVDKAVKWATGYSSLSVN
jgi:hypothetical protein